MESSESRGGWVASIIQYVAWLVAAILSLVDMLAIREAILAIMSWYKVIESAALHRAGVIGDNLLTGFGISAADNIILVILACAAISVTIWSEYYFRKGRPLGLLYKRIGKVLGIEIGVVVLAIIIRTIVATIMQANPGY